MAVHNNNAPNKAFNTNKSSSKDKPKKRGFPPLGVSLDDHVKARRELPDVNGRCGHYGRHHKAIAGGRKRQISDYFAI